MNCEKASPKVNGKTIRLSWTDGPTKGTTQAHHFFPDGTVEWHSDPGNGKANPGSQLERPTYMAKDIDGDNCLVSYLSRSGYTLTVALNFEDGSTVGVASNDKNWYPVRGTFELVE